MGVVDKATNSPNDDAFEEMFDALRESYATHLPALLMGKLNEHFTSVAEALEDKGFEIENLLPALDEIDKQHEDPQGAYEAKINWLQQSEGLGLNEQKAKEVVVVEGAVTIAGALLEFIAYEAMFPSEVKCDFSWRRAHEEYKNTMLGYMNKFGGVGEQQARQVIGNFEASIKKDAQKWMVERGFSISETSQNLNR